MRVLLNTVTDETPGDISDDTGEDRTALHDLYAAGWLKHGGVRSNFISSTDGAASIDGLSRGLQTKGDNRIFAVLRDLADVVLVASGTTHAENYRPVTLTARRAARRAAYGLPGELPLAIVTPSLSLKPDDAVLVPTAGAARPFILTTASAGNSQLRSELAAVAEVIDCGANGVEPTQVRAALAARGLRRVLCEGGPHLLAALAATGAIDEFCLSLPALLAGPGAGRIIAGASWPAPEQLELLTALEEEGALFLRYRAAHQAARMER